MTPSSGVTARSPTNRAQVSSIYFGAGMQQARALRVPCGRRDTDALWCSPWTHQAAMFDVITHFHHLTHFSQLHALGNWEVSPPPPTDAAVPCVSVSWGLGRDVRRASP